uniref:Uncharacterized protein n=1 Tax=Hippocampus comes TaxID=109280 RepID=A0A3Q2XZR2_HIPCM
MLTRKIEVMAAKVESKVIDEKLENLARSQKELDEEITKYNKVVASNQAESSSIDALITQKQTAIANYNKKKDLIAARTGHEDFSPLQIKVAAIKTQTEELAEKIKNDQQLWLRLQGTLVGLTLEIQAYNKEYNKLQAKYTVTCHLEVVHREENEVEKSNKMLQRDLLKLNTLVSKNTQLRDALEQENAAIETDFLHKLKEAERESIEMECKLEKTRGEKEKLLRSLVEAERQIMLWEKKTQLMKETRLVVEEGHGDIQITKDDIHRMEVRELVLLKNVCEITEGDTLLLFFVCIHYLLCNNLTMYVFKMVKEWDQELKELQESRLNLSNIVAHQKQQLLNLSGTSRDLETDLEKIQDAKNRDQAYLMEFQSKAKKLQEVTDGKYRPSSSTSQSVEAATQNLNERLLAVCTIIHRVCEEFPVHREALCALLLPLEAGTHSLQEQEATCE